MNYNLGALGDLARCIDVATGADRTLDVRILAAIEQTGQWSDADIEYACSDPERTCSPPHYTGSVDAALKLFRKVLPGWAYALDECRRDIHAWVCPDDGRPSDGYEGWGENMPLAILAATVEALCALLQQAKGQGGGDG